MSKPVEVGYDNIGGVSDMEKKITKEEFAKSFVRSYGSMLKKLTSGEPIKGNIDEKIAKWERWAEEADEAERRNTSL